MIDEILEDKIFNFADELESASDLEVGYKKTLEINEEFQIKAEYIVDEDGELLYKMYIINTKDQEVIDSIYCELDADEIENVIYFFIEEYTA